MINFLAELSRRINGKMATPSIRWSRQYNIYEIYIGQYPGDTYWTRWGGWYDHAVSSTIEFYLDGWLLSIDTENGLLASIAGYAGMIWIDGDYVYIHIHRHPWLYNPSKVQMFSREAYLFAPKNSADPADLFINGKISETRLDKPSINVKLSNPISGLTKYTAFTISLDNTDGAFDGDEIEEFFNTPAYIRKTGKDRAEYDDFIPIRAGMVEDIKIDNKKQEVSCADKFRSLDDPVCKTIYAKDYDITDAEWEKDDGGNYLPARWKDDVEGKALPVVYGECTLPLIEIVETVYDEIDPDLDNDMDFMTEDQKKSDDKLILKGKYLVGEGVTRITQGKVSDSRILRSMEEMIDRSKTYPLVYGDDDTAIPCEFDMDTGIITVKVEQLRYTLTGIGDDGNPIYDDMEKIPKPKYSIVTGYTDKTIDSNFASAATVKCGNVIKSLINRSAYLDYNDSLFDMVETGAYITNSPTVSMAITGGDLKKAIEDVLKNDTAFLMQKHNGKLSVRRWGKTYPASGAHNIESWLLTQNPQKNFSQAKDKYFSSCIIKYDYDANKKEHRKRYVYTEQEEESEAKYLKKSQATFETCLVREEDAKKLAERLGGRFCELKATISLGVGADCSEFDLLDTVRMSIEENGRRYVQADMWIIRELDPAQDKLVLEEINNGYSDTTS